MVVEALYGNEGYAENFPRTQIYQATHNENDERLKYMHRSFISFSFGGRWIEDFNLIAVTNGDRIQRSGSGAFEDLVTNYEVLDGQFYWGTHYLNNQLQLSLATDSITQNQLDDFLHWFAGGCTRELILAEHPNRAIMARIAEPPVLSLLPFEKKISTMINSTFYETSTTEYKGEIGLNFIMDEPFWHSKSVLLASDTSKEIVDKWKDANDNIMSVYSDKDAIKVIVEDGVPTVDMIQVPILMGKDVVIDLDYSVTGASAEGEQTRAQPIKNENGVAVAAASSEDMTIDDAIGIIGGRITSPVDNTEVFNIHYLYYPGTAPVAPIVKFKFKLEFNDDGYIITPKNSFVDKNTPYNTLTLESINKYELRFSLPGAFMAYNKAINIIYSSIGKTGLEVKKLILNNVKHAVIRGYVVSVISDEDIFNNDNVSEIINNIKNICGFNNDNNYSTVTIDCKTGKATGTLGYTNAKKEDVGDMIKSNYLLLRDRNYLNKNGQIVGYRDERLTQDDLNMTASQYNEYIKGYAYKIYYDRDENYFNNLIITYDYMYY